MNMPLTLIRNLFHKITERIPSYRELKPNPLIMVFLTAAAIVSCAARESAEPAVNTDAVTPGASAAEGGRDSRSAAPEDAEAHGLMPPGSHVAAASRDDDSWRLVTDVNSEREFEVYVDTSTIQTIDGEVYSWSKLVFDEDQRDSDGLVYREVVISSAIDCAKNTYSYKSSKFYDALGRMVFMENIATNTSEIPAKSVSRHIADFVCGYDPAAAKKAAPPIANPPQKSK
ncbi:MAG: surface-adhesin E family protein [Thermodesulfobacteriota bacterium]